MSGHRAMLALFAASSPSRDPRRIKFIAEVLEMLESLSEGPDPTLVRRAAQGPRSNSRFLSRPGEE